MNGIRVPEVGDPAQEWNHDTRQYTEWENGAVREGFPRAYTDEENELADIIVADVAAGTNEESVRTKLTGWMLQLQTAIQDTANATINQNPASYIKNAYRIHRLLIRIVLRQFDDDE